MTVQASRPYHHGNLRAALLEAAERRLASDGTDALSLRDIAREVGVSHAAPRRHFAGKQALLDALALDGFERLGAEMDAALHEAGDAFGARFHAFARTYVDFATRHRALLEVMFAGKHREGSGLDEAAARAFGGPLALFADGQAAGDVVAGDPERVAKVAWAALHGLAALANGGVIERSSLDEIVPEAVERLLSGLRPR